MLDYSCAWFSWPDSHLAVDAAAASANMNVTSAYAHSHAYASLRSSSGGLDRLAAAAAAAASPSWDDPSAFLLLSGASAGASAGASLSLSVDGPHDASALGRSLADALLSLARGTLHNGFFAFVMNAVTFLMLQLTVVRHGTRDSTQLYGTQQHAAHIFAPRKKMLLTHHTSEPLAQGGQTQPKSKRKTPLTRTALSACV